MKMKLFLFCLVFSIPLSAVAGGTHSGGHHHDDSADHSPGGHASAVGAPAGAESVTQTIHVDLLDTMRFAFNAPLSLKHGDVVRFVVKNRGQIRHEFSIGNESEQDAHRAMMRSMPNMVHDDPNAVTVEPGDTKELIWRFEGSDPVVFACNIPGHVEAGMIKKVKLGS